MFFKIFKAGPQIKGDEISFTLEFVNGGHTISFTSDILYDININLDPFSIQIDKQYYNIFVKDDVLSQFTNRESVSSFTTEISRKNKNKMKVAIKEFFKSHNIEPIDGCFNFNTNSLQEIL